MQNERDTHALHYRQTHLARSVAAEPRRARSSDLTFLSSSACPTNLLVCRGRSPQFATFSPICRDFRFGNGKVDVKSPRRRPRHRRLSVISVAASSPERILRTRRSLERHHRRLVAYAAPDTTGAKDAPSNTGGRRRWETAQTAVKS